MPFVVVLLSIASYLEFVPKSSLSSPELWSWEVLSCSQHVMHIHWAGYWLGYPCALRKADVACCECVCFVGLTISWFSTHFNKPAARTMAPTMSRVLWCLRVPFVTPEQQKVCLTMIGGSVEEQRFPRMQVYILALFVVLFAKGLPTWKIRTMCKKIFAIQDCPKRISRSFAKKYLQCKTVQGDI